MTKFEEALETISAAKDVADTLSYYVKDRTDQYSYYVDRAKQDADENGEIDPDNYYLKQANGYKRQAEMFADLIEYLEKKYLK